MRSLPRTASGRVRTSAEAIATTTIATPPQVPISLWANTSGPKWVNTLDNQPVELGMLFQSDIGGFITSVRFYKSTTNTGPHVAHLWAADGTLLATATFTNETRSGWQTVNFAQPVAIKAHRTYIASYHTDHGNYAQDIGFFSNGGVDSGVLHALADGVSGANGLFQYGPGGFPTSYWQSSNYWVDVVFVSSVPEQQCILCWPGVITGWGRSFPPGTCLRISNPGHVPADSAWRRMACSKVATCSKVAMAFRL